MKTTKRAYLDALLTQGANWVSYSYLNPFRNMKPIHRALHLIALRQMGVNISQIRKVRL